MSGLGFRLTIDGVEDDTLVVRDFQGCDAISAGTDGLGSPVYGYRYQINFASRSAGLTAEQIVDHTALLEVIRDGFVLQRVHGIVRNFSRGDTGHHHSFYTLTLVPSLERLALRRNSRSFQDLTVPEILSILMKEMEINDYIDGIKRTCAKREFCVQYRETDLEFFHRLAAEEGIMYAFIHQKDKHILLLTDDPEGFPTRDEPVLYNNLSGGVSDLPYISSLSEHYQSQSNKIQMQDYSFKKPGYSFQQSAEAVNINQLETYEYFDHPGRFKDDGNGKAFTQIRLDALRREYHTATGKSDQPRLQAGLHFYVGDHFDPAMNRDWIVVASSHQGSQPQALEEGSSAGATTYSNQFKLIPGDKVWRAMPEPAPQVDGPCIATVVGPDGEEIYCDEFGRVKLHFPWDRYSNTDDQSSCWIRVSQGWAGPQYGTVMIPRVGHEVVVSFLNGDPDQPIVTGRTYHASNKAPYALPDNKTKTVLRTETHQGEGYNELSFEDQSGSEQIFIHGQKDADLITENDEIHHVKHDRHLTIENNRWTHIKKDSHLTVEEETREKITGNQSLVIDGEMHIKAGKVWVNETGTEVHIKAGETVVLEAGNELTLKAGGSFVKVDPGGVSLKGAKVGLNSGGSAGSGSGYAGEEAELPNELEYIKGPKSAKGGGGGGTDPSGSGGGSAGTGAIEQTNGGGGGGAGGGGGGGSSSGGGASGGSAAGGSSSSASAGGSAASAVAAAAGAAASTVAENVPKITKQALKHAEEKHAAAVKPCPYANGGDA
ncbi:Phage-related baseplate assembly protein [Vibrio aerogenes CECT 7868]|uniref:Phage-related baseplate assembly protein n=3 Tax=Vibrio aerogenes TaxID=92172 RepID=A0A1M5UEB5_9VIBR|nr:type VI secretion system tip protein TssI/VgrG [Vibrio aerogenes]SHH61307.1 Phage-related baseplate assembly protein [Vibrio aerogenes CECT 7868]